MENIYMTIIEFLATFLIIYTLYYFFIIRKCKKNRDYVPAEVNLILIKYRIDYKKIDIYSMVKVVSFVTTIILSFAITLVIKIYNNTIISLLFGTLLSLLLAIICYQIIGNHYAKQSKNKK